MAEQSSFNQYVINPAKRAFVNLTKGADLSGLPYDEQLASLTRRQKLAELLMQQGQEQPEVLTYKGIAAQPSVASGISKALSQFMGAYMGGKADKDSTSATAAEKAAINEERARIFARNPAVAATEASQGDYIGDDAEGVPNYNVNAATPGKAASDILDPEAQINALYTLGGRSSLAAKEADRYLPLAMRRLERADAEIERGRPQFKTVGEGDTPGTFDPNTNKFTPTGGGRAPPPYSGTGESSQDYNILLEGDPSSPVYLAAWNRQSAPRMSLDSATGQIVYQTPNMSAFRSPSGRPTDGGNAPGQGVGGGPNQRSPGITFAPIPGATPPTSEGERKAATLLASLRSSQAQLVAATNESSDAASPTVMGSIAGSINPKLGNAAITDQRQRVEAAQLDILDAALTLRTGAAYTKEQLEGMRASYFPQLFDKPGNIKDKKDRLDNLIRQAEIAAGRSAPQGQAPGLSNSDDNTPPLSVLAEGRNTTFGNGQVWTLRDGIAVKVK